MYKSKLNTTITDFKFYFSFILRIRLQKIQNEYKESVFKNLKIAGLIEKNLLPQSAMVFPEDILSVYAPESEFLKIIRFKLQEII